MNRSSLSLCLMIVGASASVISVIGMLYGWYLYQNVANQYYIMQLTNQTITSQTAQSMINTMTGCWQRMLWLVPLGVGGAITAAIGVLTS